MSTTAQSSAAAAGPSRQTEFNLAFAGNLQAPSGPAEAVDTASAAKFDTSTQLSVYLTIYIEILDAVNNQDFLKMKLQISHFKSVLTSQLTESFRALVLVQKMGGQPASDASSVVRFHHDMVTMGSKILPLLNRYDSRHTDDHSIAGLLADLTDVGEILMAA